MYINALRHHREPVKLSLTTKTLKETKERGTVRMFVLLKDIKKALAEHSTCVFGYWVEKEEADDDGMELRFYPFRNRIGCCDFTPAAFKKIVAAARKAR